MNHDNIINKVSRVHYTEDISAKTGNPYYRIHVEFVSGYKYVNFLTEEQYQLIKLVSESSESVAQPAF